LIRFFPLLDPSPWPTLTPMLLPSSNYSSEDFRLQLIVTLSPVAVAGLVGPPDFDFDFAAMADDLTTLSPVTMLSLGPPDFDFVAVIVAEFDTDVVPVTAADVVAAVLRVLIVCLGLSWSHIDLISYC
jgi:hypothetical protein